MKLKNSQMHKIKPVCFFIFSFLGILEVSWSQSRLWTRMEGLPDPAPARNHPITFTLDGKGYVMTGNTINNSLVFKDIWRYDPDINQWEELPPFPGSARGYAYGVAYKGKAYIGFGLNPSTGFLRDLWTYDPVLEKWDQLPSCPCEARAHPAFVAVGGKIYMAAGGGASGDLKDFWSYDIKDSTWTQLQDFPGPKRHHPYYFEIGDDVYVGFGHSGPNIYKDLFRYQPGQARWSQVASLPDQGRVAGTQFSYNGKGYILSGQGEDHLNLRTGEFWEYDPVTNSWDFLPSHPGSGRWAPGSFVIGDHVYFTSGTPDAGDVKDLWMFDMRVMSAQKPSLSESDIRIFPNPVSDYLVIQSSDTHWDELSLIDALGCEYSIAAEPGNKVDLRNYPAGFYLLKIRQSDKVLLSRFQIVR